MVFMGSTTAFGDIFGLMDPALEILRGGFLPTTVVRVGFASSRPRLCTVVKTATVGMFLSIELDVELGVASVAELPVDTDGNDDEAIGDL